MNPENMMTMSIAFNQQRAVSQTTHLKCAKCGGDNAISNRDVLPWRLETITIDNSGKGQLFRLIWCCNHCNEEYDLGLLKS